MKETLAPHAMIKLISKKELHEEAKLGYYFHFSKLISIISTPTAFIFSKLDIATTWNPITLVPIPRRNAVAGMVAPHDLIVPAGPTGVEPVAAGSFFHTIPIKISQGQVYLVEDSTICKKGEEITPAIVTIVEGLGILQCVQFPVCIPFAIENGEVISLEGIERSAPDLMQKSVQMRSVTSLLFRFKLLFLRLLRFPSCFELHFRTSSLLH